MIMDIPRTNENYIPYKFIEQLQSGLLYSGKYEGGDCVFNPPHVMCFANFMPVFCAMSNDRWRVSELVQDWNPDGSRLGEPRDGEITRDQCEAIQREIDTEKMRAEICKRLDKEMEITQIEEEERQTGGGGSHRRTKGRYARTGIQRRMEGRVGRCGCIRRSVRNKGGED